MKNFKCDNCTSADLPFVYNPYQSTRGVKVHICSGCGLVQSLPRIAHVKDRPRKVTSGAAWGNVRYGKGFITHKSINIISKFCNLNTIENLCDVGANRGSFINKIHEEFPSLKVTAIEPDVRVIDDYFKHDKLELIFDRVENVEINPKTFDFIYSAHTLEHLESPFTTLQKLRKWIKDDGLCYFEVPNLDFINSTDIIEEFFIDKHTYHYSKKSFYDLIVSAGFEVVKDGEFIDNENITLICKPSVNKSINLKDSDFVKYTTNQLQKYDESFKKNLTALKSASEKLKLLCADNNVAFWGAGRIFDSFVVNGGFEVKSLKALVDKELPKYVKDMHGKKVLYPSELQNIEIDIIVIASRAYEDEIISEINSMNLTSKVIPYQDLVKI